MKKKISVTAVAFLIFVFAMLPGGAADFNAAVGDIMIPFRVSDMWKISTPGHIDSALCERKSLDESQVSDFMNTFHYNAWLTAEPSSEIIIRSEPAPNKISYQTMSAQQLHAEMSAVANSLMFSDLARLEKIEKYPCGGVLFVKYTITLQGSLYAVYFQTIASGVKYEIRFFPGESKFGDKMLRDLQSVADDLGTALTFPENYEKAPATIISEPQVSGMDSVDLGSADDNGVLIADNTDVGDRENDIRPEVIELGTDGETIIAVESIPSADYIGNKKTSSALPAVCCAVAVCMLTVIIIIKKKKSK